MPDSKLYDILSVPRNAGDQDIKKVSERRFFHWSKEQENDSRHIIDWRKYIIQIKILNQQKKFVLVMRNEDLI